METNQVNQKIEWKDREMQARSYLQKTSLIENVNINSLTTTCEHNKVVTFWNFNAENVFIGYFDFGYISVLLPEELHSNVGWYSKDHPNIENIIKMICMKKNARVNDQMFALFHMHHELGIPIYRQLADQIEYLVIGDNLPSVREVAAKLEISVTTVSKAYGVAVKRGFIVRSKGKLMTIADNDSFSRNYKNEYLKKIVFDLVVAAEHLDLSKEDVIEQIKNVWGN